MCGISGLVDFTSDLRNPIYESIIKTMNFGNQTRGPDQEFYWTDENVRFGHRRLILIDRENGRQPMEITIQGKTYVIVFNGEIYNMPELLNELRNNRLDPVTRSDTEILLRSYILWGQDVVHHIRGIFAFAIWDKANRSLFIARDQFGIKPLFWARVGSSFLFGSEMKVILGHPAISRDVDLNGLADMLMIGPVRTPGECVFKQIEELRPGHWLMLGPEKMKIHRYWELKSAPHTDNRAETIERINQLFERAITEQMVCDVPLGAMLSGGLDSSAIDSFAANLRRTRNEYQLSTFSVDYEGEQVHFEDDQFITDRDVTWADTVAKFIESNHKVYALDNKELLDAIIPAMVARDLPGMADIDSSLLLFCRAIKQQGKCIAVLSGEGADEFWGGYPWFRKPELRDAPTFPWSRLALNRIQFIRPDVLSKDVATDYLNMRYKEALAEVPRLEGETDLDARIREIHYLTITRWFPNLLERTDRMSMASGVEVRVPFCDHELVEYSWNVPWSMKIKMFNEIREEKGLLREAFYPLLPEDVVKRLKSPYPKTHNPYYLQRMQKTIQDLTNKKDEPLFQILDHKSVKSFVDGDISKVNFPWFGQLMNVPAFLATWWQMNEWMKLYNVKIIK